MYVTMLHVPSFFAVMTSVYSIIVFQHIASALNTSIAYLESSEYL